MKRLEVFLGIIAMSFLASALASSPQVKPQYVLTDLTKPIVLSAKQKLLQIVLPANRTTGYQWFLQSLPEKMLMPIKQFYVVRQVGKVGAGGLSVWQFAVNQRLVVVPSVVYAEFVYMQPWVAKQNKRIKATILLGE